MLIIGHRGAKGLAPENTKASFDAAIQHGVDAIEFDVRTTKDNVAVITHDPFIIGSKTKYEIAANDYITLQQAYSDLLTLSEALDYIGNRLQVIIEIKPESDISPILKDIEHALRSGWSEENIAISSFSFHILTGIKRVLPDIRLIVNEKWSGVRATTRARKLETKHITMDHRWLWSGFIRSITKSGYMLTVYSINDPKKAARWAKMGLYGAVTDYPDRFNTKT